MNKIDDIATWVSVVCIKLCRYNGHNESTYVIKNQVYPCSYIMIPFVTCRWFHNVVSWLTGKTSSNIIFLVKLSTLTNIYFSTIKFIINFQYITNKLALSDSLLPSFTILFAGISVPRNRRYGVGISGVAMVALVGSAICIAARKLGVCCCLRWTWPTSRKVGVSICNMITVPSLSSKQKSLIKQTKIPDKANKNPR